MTAKPVTPYTPPPSPEPITLLAGYARWWAFLNETRPGWQAEDLTLASLRQSGAQFGEVAPTNVPVYQTHFSGLDWNGAFDRPAYLCLSEAEARMIQGEVQGPKRKVARLYFSSFINVRHETLPLGELLAAPEGQSLLYERLRAWMPYTPDDYARANSLCLMLDEARIRHFLYRDGVLLPPADPQQNLPRDMRFDQPMQVWSAAGLSGLIDAEGRFLLPCRYGYLSSPSYGLIEASPAFRAPVTLPIDHFDFLRYTCDVIEYETGRQVNPPGLDALQGSQGVGDTFVAVPADLDPAQPRMGFMNREGQWLGRADWRDVLLDNEFHAAVQCPDTGLWGFIDRHGELAIPPRFSLGGHFNNGVAIVPLPESQAVAGARWLLIDTQGRQLAGPWHDIEHDRGATFLVQDGEGRWGLIHRDGTLLVEPQAFDAAIGEDERIARLREGFRQRRQQAAARLYRQPLAEVAGTLDLNGQRDFMEYGLWGRAVHVRRLPEHWQAVFGATTQGRIGWEYPVSASLFNFKIEAPVVLDHPGDAPLTLGIAWGDLELRG